MNALANSLLRIWSAKNRLPRLTGRGSAGSCRIDFQETASGGMKDAAKSAAGWALNSLPNWPPPFAGRLPPWFC